jgi:pyridoxamine 5'-phosphate oxidase family protein
MYWAGMPALVVDDLESISPWKPRGIKIHGKAEIVERQGQFGLAPYLKMLPAKYWSWGIERPIFEEGKAVIKKKRIEQD